ncbi:hypothetical protein JW948_07505 [bacterium]|nr:hypothetical protein [bacterium]
MKRILIGIALFGTALRISGQADVPERSIHYRPGDWISYPVLRFQSSVALGDETVYIGTTGGILRYHLFHHEWDWPFTYSDGLENGDVGTLVFDRNSGYLWCATPAGISYREPASEYWRTIHGIPDLTRTIRLGVGDTYVWAGTGQAVYRIDRTTGFVWADQVDPSGDHVIWHEHGSCLDSRYFLDPKYIFVPSGIQDMYLRQYPATDCVRDPYQIRWISTWGLGTGRADERTLDLDFEAAGPYSSDICAMAWDSEGMWMGGHPVASEPPGITYWNMESSTWRYFEAKTIPGLRSDAVNAIVPFESAVWFATDDGLARYDPEEDSWRTFTEQDGLWDDKVTCLATDETMLWVGTAYGLSRVHLASGVIKKVNDERLNHRRIFQLDVDDGVWAGTDRGIARYTAQDNRWEMVEGYAGMLPQEITAVAVFGHEVWFGTSDGVEMFDRAGQTWTGFPGSHFPVKERIHCILPDNTCVWVGTDEGVFKYIRDEDRWKQYTVKDGLLNDSVRWMLLDGDDIWFGTPLGLTRFYWNAPYRVD